ncbi:MAG: HAMP domain-containing sensor histidine kinase [Candidatus Bipolaricaulota bacterium]
MLAERRRSVWSTPTIVHFRFAVNDSHELRTPLTVIQGNLEALMDGVFPLTADSLSSVHEETLYLGALIEELRDLTLAEGGRLRLEQEPLDLGALVQGTCESQRPAATEQNIRLEVNAPEEIWVLADRRRMRQVIANLLSNALRFSPEGEDITVTCHRKDGQAEVSVSDHGPGIAPKDLPYVFERFYKADPSRADQGSGLGLAIAREIVHAHGGQIWAESELGQGTRLTLTLPLVADQQGDA